MLFSAYKTILDALPEGVFVFDDRLRLQYTNAAFRGFFATENYKKDKKSNALAAAVGCKQQGRCGESSACNYCAFLRTMQSAIDERAEKTETVHTSLQRAGRTDKLSLRIRIKPLDKKGKLFLGITDGTYETEMEQEMLSAKRMQQRLLPSGKSMGGVAYDFLYIPCHEVGGDLPQVYELDGEVYGVLADVSGKGVSAGLLSAFVRAGLDKTESDLSKVLQKLNGKFNEIAQDERSYITLTAVRIDKRGQALHYCVAGHNAPILLKNRHGINEIESPAPPISNWMPDFAYSENEFAFESGDILALVTDGVTECMNAKGEQFGIERTESVLMQSQNANDFIGKLKTALGVFSGGKFTDDVTAIAFDL